MVPIVKKFIEAHIDLIDTNRFYELYSNTTELNLLSEIGAVSATLLACDIDILTYTKGLVPEGFLARTLITKFEIPNEIKIIEHAAFYDCSELQELTLPYSLEEIGSSAFNKCIKLHTLIWNAIKLTSCDRRAFNSCHSLEKIIFGSTMENWRALNERCKIVFPSGVVPQIECTDGIINERI